MALHPSVHASSVFEMPPVGIISIKQHMEKCGLKVDPPNNSGSVLANA